MSASTVTSAGPEDAIAAVWFALDRRPTDSLVLAGLHGPRHRLGAMVRCDRQPRQPWPPGALGPPLARLRETGASAVIALVFGPDALRARGLVAYLEAEVGDLPLLDVLGVTPTAYVSLRCPDPACCPPHGHPIAEVTASRAAVLHVLAGHSLSPVVPGPDRVEEYLRWCRALAGGEVTEGLGATLADGHLRDAVLLNLLGAPGTWINEVLTAPGDPGPGAFVSDLGDDDEAAGRLEELLTRRPDPERLERGERALTAAAERSAPAQRPPVLAVLAVLAWLDGRTVRAGGLVARAYAAGPELHLLRLVAELLARGIEPPWQEQPPQR
jgi:uncharacterized protein DUF4192